MAASNLNETASRLMAALRPVKVIDERAETAEEISARLGLCGSHTRSLILADLKSGKLEQVWKKGRIRLVPAYRCTKNAR